MNSNKKYFWLKLQKTFFDDVKVKMLRKIAGGDTYTIIYLKLMLQTVDHDGELKLEGLTEDPIQEISMLIDESEDNIRACIELLHRLKLCDTNGENILFYEVIANTGKETSSARRVREFRTRQNLLQCNTSVTKSNTELEKDIELDLNKEKDIKKEKEVKHKYGEYKNILLTDKELEKLKEKFPSSYKEKIEYISEGIELKGYKYKSHYLAILKWFKDSPLEKKENRNLISSYTFINIKCQECGGEVGQDKVCHTCKIKVSDYGEFVGYYE